MYLRTWIAPVHQSKLQYQILNAKQILIGFELKVRRIGL